jgi:outer membrane protein
LRPVWPALPLVLLAGLAGGVFLLPPPLVSQTRPITELTPDQAVRLGLENNHRIQAVRADAEGARAAYREARASRLPAVRIRGDYRRLVGDLPSTAIEIPGFDPDYALFRIPRDQVHTEVSFEQPLFHGGVLRNRTLAAEHEAAAAEVLVGREEADVALAVRRAYWDLYYSLAVQEAATAALERVEAHLTDLENLFEEGVVLRSDLLAARTRRSEVRLDRVEADDRVRSARLELNRLIGRPLDEEVRPVTPEDALPLEEETDALVDHARQGSPHLRAMAEQSRALERQVQAARGAWLPQVSLLARYTYARPNALVFAEMDEFRGIGEAGVVLSWSVFEGGRRSAGTERARAQLRAADARLADAREEVEVRVRREHQEVTRAAEVLEVAREHLEEAGESYRVVREQFEEGVVLSARVLEAEEVYRAAEARHAAAVAENALARASLLHALGEVW